MSVTSSNVYLLTLSPDKASRLLDHSLDQGVDLSVISPTEMGGDWQSVAAYGAPSSNSDYHRLEKILDKTLPEGAFAGFEDNRVESSVDSVNQASGNSEAITSKADKVIKYYELRERYEESKGKGYNKTLDSQSESLGEVELELLKKVEIAAAAKNNSKLSELKIELEKLEKDRADLNSQSTESIKKELKSYIAELNSQKLNPEKLSNKEMSQIRDLYASLELKDKKQSVLNNLFKVDDSAGDYFWIVAVDPANDAKFQELAKSNGVNSIKIGWDKQIVKWQEKGGLDAFKGVAVNLGSVSTREYNPTGVVAVFFMLFFAFCLADVIYALIIAGFTGFFLFTKKNLKPGFKSFFNLFFWSSLLTVAFGMVTGSWAGDLLAALSPALGEKVAQLQLIDFGLSSFAPDNVTFPVNEALKNAGLLSNPIVAMLALSAVIGLIHTIIGYSLKAYNARAEGDRMGFISEVNWVIFILLGIFLMVTSAAFPALKTLAQIMFALSGVGLFVLNNGKGPVKKLLGGFGKVYELVAVFADSMSYTRLVAVGLTGGIISMVINLLALNMVGDEGSIMGWFFAILVLLIGHSLNLVITLFGAYINPLRLHYVEFMPKFFKGEAKAFEYNLDSLKYTKFGK